MIIYILTYNNSFNNKNAPLLKQLFTEPTGKSRWISNSRFRMCLTEGQKSSHNINQYGYTGIVTAVQHTVIIREEKYG